MQVDGAEVLGGMDASVLLALGIAALQRAVGFGLRLLDPFHELRKVKVHLKKLLRRKESQLRLAHGAQLIGEDGDVCHDRLPHWKARAKVEWRETRRSKASISVRR